MQINNDSTQYAERGLNEKNKKTITAWKAMTSFRLQNKHGLVTKISARSGFLYFIALSTVKRILDRLHHHLLKFHRSVFLILKPISYFLAFMWLGFFLSRSYWSSLDHDLWASTWEKAISIMAWNSNSGRSCLIAAVGTLSCCINRNSVVAF